MDPNNSKPTVEKLDAAFYAYYKRMGVGERYLNDGEGMFQAWCDENGYDDESLQDEFDDLADSNLLTFDEDSFPLSASKQHLQGDERKAAVADVFRRWETIGLSISLCSQADFDAVTPDEMQRMRKIYGEACPAIYNQGMKNDSSLLTMLAVQYRLGFEYLQYLVDCYNLYRIKQSKQITASEWAKLPNNQHFRLEQLKKIIVKSSNKLTSYEEFAAVCIHSYMGRIAPKLILKKVKIRIDDSIEDIMNYLCSAAMFVGNVLGQAQNLKDQAITVCPFQFDFCIAVGIPKIEEKEDGDNDADDDDDDDDDAEDTQTEQANINYTEDYIGNIGEKLDNNKVKYAVNVDEETEELHENDRRFGNLLNALAENEQINLENHRHFLHGKRVVSILDRRPKKKDPDAKEPAFLFVPPGDSYTAHIPIGKQKVPEWYVSASRSCLLPPGPEHKFDEEDAVGNKQNVGKKPTNTPGMNIGASFHTAGQLLTFSFQVDAADKIKLYMFWNGQMIRLLPRDCLFIFSKIFVSSDENEKYLKEESQERKSLMQKLEKIIVDEQFDAWLEKFPGPEEKK